MDSYFTGGDAEPIDLGDSLLFKASPLMPAPEEPVGIGEKVVKHFDGSIRKLKQKTKSPIDPESYSEPVMNATDINELFSKANEILILKENQRQLEAQTTEDSKQYIHNTIWTEKYRPKKFVELCSAGNDKQYRAISHWLQRWTASVFNVDISPHKDGFNVDGLGRPYNKILLITGPPGIGKTTAVHLIAKQFGYHVEELNATNSMDSFPNSSGPNNTVRSALKLKITNALTSNSIQTQGSKIIKAKPTCLVIDEIDSLGNVSDIIRVLHELVQADQRAMTHKLNKSKSSKKDKLLNRPIICIANDAFTTNARTWGGFSMEKLRSISTIVTFYKPGFITRASGIKAGGSAINSVKEYLKYISESETLNLEYKEINDIVEVCEGDIRASINHLQFNCRRVDDGSTHTNGNKDVELSWFKLTDLLFKRDPQLSKDQDFDQLVNKVMSSKSSSGIADKTIKACFNKYLDVVHYQDDSLQKPCELSNWFDFYEKCNGTPYHNLIMMKIWQLFSEIHPKQITNSLLPDIKSQEFASNELHKRNQEVIKRFIESIPVTLKLSLGGGFEYNQNMGLFIMPHIHKMITPELGGSSSMKANSSLNAGDKQCLGKVANICKSLKFEIQTFKDYNNNQIELEMTPNLDSLVIFNESKLKAVNMKRQWYLPVLQVELNKLEVVTNAIKRTQETINKPNKKMKISNSVDFFKGQYEELTPMTKHKDQSMRIWVKFNEGYSNAVRKTIGWKDFWN